MAAWKFGFDPGRSQGDPCRRPENHGQSANHRLSQTANLLPPLRKKAAPQGHHTLLYRTMSGKLRVRRPRLYHCVCQPQPTRTFNPLAQLLPERTAPELLYLETKFVSLMSYGLTVNLLQEVFPCVRVDVVSRMRG